MAPGDQQSEERERGRLGLEQRRQQMALEMVDADRGPAPGVGQAPGEPSAHQQRPDQSRAGRVGDAVDGARDPNAAAANASRTSGSSRRTWSREASSGTTPPYGLVQRDLTVKPVGQQPARRVVNGHRGLIARALNADDAHESGQNACQPAYKQLRAALVPHRLCLLSGRTLECAPLPPNAGGCFVLNFEV